MTTETAREPLTVGKFVERHGITLTAVPVPLVEHWEGDKEAQSWCYTLKCGSREMSGTFTKGSAHRIWSETPKPWGCDRPRTFSRVGERAPREGRSTRGYEEFMAWSEPEPPTAEEILDSLASDVSSIDQPFEEWASEYGYDTDSRKAEKTYEACRTEYYNLRKLLGARDLETLLNDVVRM